MAGQRRWARGFLVAALAAYLLALLRYRYADFPGLHGDEAWVGRFAYRLKMRGFYTPHEMNTYTGALYGLLLERLFARFGTTVAVLRGTGVALNSAAALLLLGFFARGWGARSALAWLYLLTTSALFVLKSRIAWEVYAFQDFFLALILPLAYGFACSGKFPVWRVLAFLGVCALGVFNHFIFLSVPVSFFALLSAERWLAGEEGLEPLRALAAANLGMCSLLFAIKSQVTEASWGAHPALIGGVFALLPVLAAAAFYLVKRLPAPRARPVPGNVRHWAAGLLWAGLTLFFAVHLKSMVQIWSGVAVFQRLVSWTPPLLLRWGLYGWAAGLLSLYFSASLGSLANAGPARWTTGERLVVLWPLAYCAVFILFRNTSSIRYYILPTFLMLAALAVILPRAAEEFPAAGWVPFFLAPAIFLNACFWREMGAPSHRPPISFRVGWHMERSRDFLPKDGLLDLIDSERVCSFPEHNSFIDQALIFHRQGHPVACDPSKSMTTRYCEDCPSPPYIAWEIGPFRPDQ